VNTPEALSAAERRLSRAVLEKPDARGAEVDVRGAET
jgi:hypothetical protein